MRSLVVGAMLLVACGGGSDPADLDASIGTRDDTNPDPGDYFELAAYCNTEPCASRPAATFARDMFLASDGVGALLRFGDSLDELSGTVAYSDTGTCVVVTFQTTDDFGMTADNITTFCEDRSFDMLNADIEVNGAYWQIIGTAAAWPSDVPHDL